MLCFIFILILISYIFIFWLSIILFSCGHGLCILSVQKAWEDKLRNGFRKRDAMCFEITIHEGARVDDSFEITFIKGVSCAVK